MEKLRGNFKENLEITLNLTKADPDYIDEPATPPRIASAHVLPDGMDADFDHKYLNKFEEVRLVTQFEFDPLLRW